MKTTIFNFLVLQLIVWAIVFSGKENESGSVVNYAVISDTWQVSNADESNEEDMVLQFPAFNKLTLNIDGTYLRINAENKPETGKWSLNEKRTVLLLTGETGTKKFDIVQLPNSDSLPFIIKENNNFFSSKDNIEYELTRM
jgi:hypothetical protein